MTGVTIVNFTHPLTAAQQAAIRRALGREIAAIIDVATDFDVGQPFDRQAQALIAGVDLTPAQWQTLPILVNLPSLAAIAAAALAQLHGLMGHFPAIIRIRPVAGAVPVAYELAEIIDLNVLRVRSARLATGGSEGVTT